MGLLEGRLSCSCTSVIKTIEDQVITGSSRCSKRSRDQVSQDNRVHPSLSHSLRYDHPYSPLSLRRRDQPQSRLAVCRWKLVKPSHCSRLKVSASIFEGACYTSSLLPQPLKTMCLIRLKFKQQRSSPGTWAMSRLEDCTELCQGGLRLRLLDVLGRREYW